jgi:hypothetical protein
MTSHAGVPKSGAVAVSAAVRAPRKEGNALALPSVCSGGVGGCGPGEWAPAMYALRESAVVYGT